MTDEGKKYIIELLQEHDRRQSRMRDNAGDMNYDMRNDRRSDMRNDMRGDMRTDRRNDMDSDFDYYDNVDERRRRDRTDNRRSSDMVDYLDGHTAEKMRLTKSQGNQWLHEMENTDGTKGPHYTMQEVMHAAEKLGIRFNDFNERQYFIAVNMWYSDYGHVTKRIVGDNKERELLANAEYAKAFLDDPDGVEAGEKLAVTYHCLRG